ncbi:MAG: VUT family protein, partial [Pseudomonadota bacterium]
MTPAPIERPLQDRAVLLFIVLAAFFCG